MEETYKKLYQNDVSANGQNFQANLLDDNLDNQMSVFNNSNNRSIHGGNRLNPSSPALKPAIPSQGFII